MSPRNELAEALLDAAQEEGIWPPADEETIIRVQQRLGIKLPADMTACYRSMNGMPWPTKPDNGWIRLWALESWQRVIDEPGLRAASKYKDLADAVIVADYCDASWWYAAQFGPGEAALEIFVVDGLREARLVASSFTAFVTAALSDSADIYPASENL